MGTREGTLKTPPERRREIARMGGLARFASAGAQGMREMGKLGGTKSLSPERRSEIARIGAIALNAKRTPEEHREHSRRGGYHAHAARLIKT